MNAFIFKQPAIALNIGHTRHRKYLGALFLSFFLSFSMSAQYSTVGNGSAAGAVCDGDCFELTPDQTYQAGAVWSNTQLDLSEGFTICFNTNFGGSDNGADGISFVLQNDSRGTSAIGGKGGYMGYGQEHPTSSGGSTISPSLAVEFDTYYNGSGGISDITDDHIAIVRNGNMGSPEDMVSADPGGADIEDGGCHNICINWDPSSSTLSVSFDGVNRITKTIDISQEIFSGGTNVNWGFTAATGAQRNRQVVCIESVDTYGNCCDSDCPDLITNGGFEAGCTGFTGDLMVPACGSISSSEESMIGDDASDWNTAWERKAPDGTGDFMIIDGPRNTDEVVWRTTIDVKAGQVYCFEALVSNICVQCGFEPSFELRTGGLTGNLIASVNNVAHSDGWVSLCGNIVATDCDESLEVNIVMLAGSGTSAGNDGAIDNISIKSLQCSEEDCCDNFSFFVEHGCNGTGYAFFTGDPALCNFPRVEITGFDCKTPIGNGWQGTYYLNPGEIRKLNAYLIDTCGDTICVKEAFASCPVVPVCCDGILVDAAASVTSPGQYDLFAWQNPFIPCPIYSIRLNGVVTVSGGGFPISFSPPCVGGGLYIGTVSPASPSYTIDYLDAFGAVICSNTSPSSGLMKSGVSADPFAASVAPQDLNMEVAPNPANEQVIVTFELPRSSNVTIEVLEMNGRQVMMEQTSAFESGAQRTVLSTTSLPAGFYFLRLSDGFTQSTRPLAIQH